MFVYIFNCNAALAYAKYRITLNMYTTRKHLEFYVFCILHFNIIIQHKPKNAPSLNEYEDIRN
jgi:hypothetical protein